MAGVRLAGLAFALALVWGTPASFAQGTRPRPSRPTNANPNSQMQKGRVVVPVADVYAGPNFDQRVIGRVRLGSTWWISKRIYGAFYQVRIGKERIGYVTDADIKPVSSAQARAAERAAKSAAKPKPPPPQQPSAAPAGQVHEGAHLAGGTLARKAFDEQDFQGVSFMMLRYREETMGLRPTDNLLTIGFKATGNDVLIEGLPTELNVQLSPAAPKYYEQATARGTEGFLFILDGMMVAPRTHGPNTMTFFGFGPMFRFSKFGVTLPVAGKDEFYSLEDMAVGMKFNVGASQRFGSFATRLDFQYFWEKQQYYGLSVAFQFASSNTALQSPPSR